ncbi:GerAB/ArcD/ProY family transporter [Rossellomorea sp. NS-SX7]|uniref:GerAB/ArcD/ProY family transporter n=1 Tax=Rossellomorea sp. NS-SX7 TaxID=3463856 RepID=UPI004059CA2F
MQTEKQFISSGQLQILVILFTCGSSILLIPPALIQAKNDGWISGIIGLMFGILIVLLYIKLSKVIVNKTIYEANEQIFTKWLGKFVNILYFLFFFFLSAQVLSNMGDFVTQSIMIETPKEYIHLLFLLPIVYGVKQGLEVISRLAEIVFPTFILLFVLFALLLLPDIELSHFEPIGESGIKNILHYSLPFLSLPFLEFIAFLILIPHVNTEVNVTKMMIRGSMIGGGLLVVLTIWVIGVLGVQVASMYAYPTFLLAKQINIADFLQRFEVLIAAIWIISLFVKLLITYYVSCAGICSLFSVKNVNLVALPMGIILWYLGNIVYPSSAYFTEFIKISLSYKLIFGIGMPLLTLMVIKVRKMKFPESSG